MTTANVKRYYLPLDLDLPVGGTSQKVAQRSNETPWPPPENGCVRGGLQMLYPNRTPSNVQISTKRITDQPAGGYRLRGCMRDGVATLYAARELARFPPGPPAPPSSIGTDWESSPSYQEFVGLENEVRSFLGCEGTDLDDVYDRMLDAGGDLLDDFAKSRKAMRRIRRLWRAELLARQRKLASQAKAVLDLSPSPRCKIAVREPGLDRRQKLEPSPIYRALQGFAVKRTLSFPRRYDPQLPVQQRVDVGPVGLGREGLLGATDADPLAAMPRGGVLGDQDGTSLTYWPKD